MRPDPGARALLRVCGLLRPARGRYDFPALTRADIKAGPRNMWRYAKLLPVPADIAARPTTEPGFTRLIRADNLAHALGMRRLWVKDDRDNPTHSFKDRVVAVALAAALEMGFKVLACPSTGNLANAVAAAAARAGIRSVVLVPADLEQQKIITTAVYGGTFVPVDGNYDDVNRLASELAGEHEDWAFVNVNVRPYYAEGSKTLGFEIAEQLGWRLPEQVVVPIASGAQLAKVDKGFRELAALGLVEDTGWHVFGAQATGCSPVSAAFAAGQDVVAPVRPATIAKSLAIGNPADGPYVLDTVRRTGGAVADVSDEEIVDRSGCSPDRVDNLVVAHVGDHAAGAPHHVEHVGPVSRVADGQRLGNGVRADRRPRRARRRTRRTPASSRSPGRRRPAMGVCGTRPSEVISEKPLSTLTSWAPDAIGTTTCSGSRQPSCSAISKPSVLDPRRSTAAR